MLCYLLSRISGCGSGIFLRESRKSILDLARATGADLRKNCGQTDGPFRVPPFFSKFSENPAKPVGLKSPATEATKREGKRRTKAETKLRQQGKKEEREEDHEKRTGGNRKTKRERNGTREKTKHLETKGRKEKQEEKKKGALGSKTQEQRSPTILELAKSDRTRNSA